MAWVALIFAGMFEVVWAVAMKQSHGFTRLVPSCITLVGLVLSLALLALALRALPLGVAYMIWTGIGAVGAFAAGVIFLGEPVTSIRIFAALLIAGGLTLMKLSSQG